MVGKINKDYYCAAGGIANCYGKLYLTGACASCVNYHRKWPTPEQFRQEYGFDYPERGLIYWRCGEDDVWVYGMYKEMKEEAKHMTNIQMVCACTPWGAPPDGPLRYV